LTGWIVWSGKVRSDWPWRKDRHHCQSLSEGIQLSHAGRSAAGVARRSTGTRRRDETAAQRTAEGLSPYKISADPATRGVKLSHVTVRKIIADRRTAA
jgi:hypothetical protein